MDYEKVQSLGVLCLGGVVLVLDEDQNTDSGQVIFYATNYRAQQRFAGLCFVGQTAASSEHGWRLHSVEVPALALDAGGDLFRIVVSSTAQETRAYEVFDRREAVVCAGSFSTKIPVGTKASVSVAPPHQRRWQALFIRSEVELRWFRSVLRKREVRVGMNELDHEFRFYAREVEEALELEEEAQLNTALERLRSAARRIEVATGIAPFPNERPLALLPEV